ncbi:hornerin [Pieris napi]|uniref:hornerin n=1 Tax=Pieris napi TaxID=78633 RepID=UPI001FB8D0AE|nr:hornerin [Pieris napi]
MRIVRVDKTGMRATRASLPLVALVFLFTQTHAQKYILCKSHGSEDCQLYSSDKDDNIVTSPFHVCGAISSLGVTRLRDQFHTIEPLGIVKEYTKNIFCKRVVYVHSVNQHEPIDYFRNRHSRAPRQATFTPRGKYRGQTQSQYLAIDRGNSKDEGKAEAHSAADSSRASVSGNSGMGQAQSQSIYDPSCDDCYGAPRKEVESLRHQPGRTTDYGPSWSGTGPEYSSRYPGGTRHPGLSPDTSLYNPDRTGLNSPNGYVGNSYRPDGKVTPVSDNQRTGYGPGGDSNGPSYNYGPRGSGSSYPGSNGYGPGKDIQSGGVGPDTPYRNGEIPSDRFGGQTDRSIPSGNFPKSHTNPLNTGNNYGLQQNGYPVQAGGHNGMPIHDLNDQNKYPTPDGRGEQSSRGNYIPNVPGQTGKNNNNMQHYPNNYNQPTSGNPNDGSYYNPRPSGPYSPGQRGGESYVPSGSSLPPGQLNAFNPKTSPDNVLPGANGQALVPQQTPTGIANYDRNRYPPGSYVSGDTRGNWPPTGPFHGPDGKTYVCCEVPGATKLQSAYGQNSGGSPNNLLAPGITQPGGNYGSEGPGEGHNVQNGPRQYSPEHVSGFRPGGEYQYPSSKYTPPVNQFVPGNAGYDAGGEYYPRGQYLPGSGSQSGVVGPGRQDTSRSSPGTGTGGHYIPGRNGEPGTENLGSQFSPGSSLATGSGNKYIPGRDTGSGTGGPGGQYSPGTGQTTGSGGQYIPGKGIGSGTRGPGDQYPSGAGPSTGSSGQYIPGRDMSSGTGGPGGQYSHGIGPSTGSGGKYIPGRDMGSGNGGPRGQYSPGTSPSTGTGGQYIPERNMGSGTGGPDGQYSPGTGPSTGSGGQYIPGREIGSGTGGPGGQYSPGTGPSTGPGTQYIPGLNIGSGTGSPGGQYSPGPITGSGGQYIPGRDMGSGTGGPGGQYSPGIGPSTGSGGQYIPGRDTGFETGGPGGQYSPGTGPSTGSGGHYIPGRDMGSGTGGPGGQYSPSTGPTTGSGGQYIPGREIGSGNGGPGGQYSPGTSPSGSGGQYIPGRDMGSGTGGPGNQYSPGTGPSTGSGGQYIPGRDTGSETGGPGGQYSPGTGPSTGSGGHYIPGRDMGSGTGSPGGQYSPSTGPTTGSGGQYIPGREIGSGIGGPGGQYSPHTGHSTGSGGQYIPERNMGSGTGGPGGQYSSGTGPSTGSEGQYIPGRDKGSGTGGPGGQYSPGTSPTTGSGERYIPRGGSGSETSSSGGPFNPGQYDLANGAPSGREGQGTNYRPDSGTGGGSGQYKPSLTGSDVSLPSGQSLPENKYGYGNSPDKVGGGPNSPYGNPGSIGSDATGRYPNGQTGTQYEVGGTNPTYNNVPQNYVDPQSVADDDDSEAEAVVSQAINGTTASATSKGGNDKARAQTHVQGTYSGSGSFQAQAQIAGENKEAESEVTGGKKGASSSATGSGRNNKSQASVQLGSETGAVQTNSQSSGAMHSSNSQVQGSVKGGTADAQARGPGSTSSQAQIGFTPYKDSEKSKHDLQKIPFVGGGMASAQSSGRTGQSQSQLHGTFKYGITYNGAAQAGASIDKDAIFPNRLAFEKIDVFNEKDKNINVDLTEPPPELETEKTPETTPALPELVVEEQKEEEVTTTEKSFDETLTDSESKYDAHPHADHHSYETTPSESTLTDNRRSFHNYYGTEYDTYTTDKDDTDDYDPESAFIPDGTEVDQGAEFPSYDEYRGDATHQSLQSPRKGVDVHQSTGGNTQHIVLGSLKKHDAEITQKSSERPDEKRIYQPGERVPGTGGYTIPIGFTGSVKSVASKDKTYVVGSRDSPSQAQTVTLTPGTGKVRYTYPSSYGKYVHPTNLRSLNSKRDDDRYVSMSKSVTRDLDNDNNIRKQYSHTYYTKSSSCGYFTFTCTMVSSAEGKKKVCKPKIPTNPDGTPIRC